MAELRTDCARIDSLLQVEGPEGQLVREMVGFVGVVEEEEEVWEARGVGFLAWRVRWAFGEGMEVW